MKIIVGLGNPDSKYTSTRHNIGFMAINKIAEDLSGSEFKKSAQFKSEVSEITAESEKILLIKPSTYMNLSGDAVQAVMSYYKQTGDNIIVIYDDIDLSLGQIRIKKKGSAGTHNGMKSIVSHIGENFLRIRIGIKGENTFHPNTDLANYVLSQFSKDEAETVAKALKKIPNITKELLTTTIEEVMNKYNS